MTAAIALALYLLAVVVCSVLAIALCRALDGLTGWWGMGR